MIPGVFGSRHFEAGPDRAYNERLMKARVSITRSPDYAGARLGDSIRKALDLVGGLDAFVKSGDRVLVKINHLSPGSPPERAVLTHPLFTREVLRLLKDRGAAVTVGDDIQSDGQDGFAASGYKDMCKSLGVTLLNLKSAGFREIDCPPGGIIRTAFISRAALESDAVVNLPKLKTHSLTAFSGAVKNTYGFVPCGQRLALHGRFPRNDLFSRMLVDVYACVRPGLTIMDGVLAMEGPGPSAGSARALGLILAGADGVAVDAVAQDLTGFRRDDVITTLEASRRGLGMSELASIDILGEKPEDVRVADFKKASIPVGLLKRRLPSAIYGYVSGQLVLVPEVVPEACSACGECARVCPREAVRWEPGAKARIVSSACIECLCCHEVCPSSAIRARPRPLGRLIRAVTSALKI